MCRGVASLEPPSRAQKLPRRRRSGVYVPDRLIAAVNAQLRLQRAVGGVTRLHIARPRPARPVELAPVSMMEGRRGYG